MNAVCETINLGYFDRYMKKSNIVSMNKELLEKYRIKVYTRSMNDTLYKKSMSFLDLSFPKVRLQGTSADGYLVDLIMDEEADIVINIDEDAFVFDTSILINLVDYVIQNGYANCGMPDGGVVHLRHFNPLVTNPFFNVFNTKLLRTKIREYKEHDYNVHKESFIEKCPLEMLKGAYEYVYFEPYYPLLIWINQNFKTLYLNANTHQDGLTTILEDYNAQPFLMHTWFSRFYGLDIKQTIRINNRIIECGAAADIDVNFTCVEQMSLLLHAVLKYGKTKLKKIYKHLR